MIATMSNKIKYRDLTSLSFEGDLFRVLYAIAWD